MILLSISVIVFALAFLIFYPRFSGRSKRNNTTGDRSTDWNTDSGSLGHFGNSIDSENSNHSSFWDWIGGDSGDSGGSDGSDSSGDSGGGDGG
ncbi:hypothetical protein CH367_11735, partial [Leptospira barantonii]